MTSIIVGLEDMGHPRALAARQLQLHIDVSAQIDDDRLPTVAEYVGGASQIAVEHWRTYMVHP